MATQKKEKPKLLSRMRNASPVALLFLLFCFGTAAVFAQTDQGTINGIVADSTGAVVPGASVTLTNTDTGLQLTGKSDQSGFYSFSPIKIGNYRISVESPGFQKTTQENLHLDVQQRLQVNVELKAGAATQTITVTGAPPLLQTEDGSSGQVLSTKTINDTPLNGRNWVFIAQLAAGVNPPSGSRGAGKGDFNANGQRAEQNNFILDGVDNNNNVVDFLSGASFVVRPPPDALAEFKIQTGAYSAEFGHSAGSVINASIKSGTNEVHGNIWEYNRNDAYDIRQYFDGNNPVAKYRQNQFGATLGFPIIKNKLFFFGDVEANRIIFGETHSGLNVPTALMRQGNFSELLNPALTTGKAAVTLYQPSTTAAGTQLLQCDGQQNVICPNQLDPVAARLMNLFPLPNQGAPGQTYNNYTVQTNALDNTWQWDTRMDYNISSKDQIFARFSYEHEPGNHPAPLGPILDGGSFGDTGNIINLGENFTTSETHIFTPTLTNEFRFGYNYGHFGYQQFNANTDIAPTLGLGGIPYQPLNGGLPAFNVGGLSFFGSPTFYVSNEYQNVWQVLDNVTKVAGNHSLHMGVNFQRIRFSTQQPTQPRGTYNYTGVFTSQVGTANTGFGAADFLLGTMNSSAISNIFNSDDVRWDRAAYFQDDWKASPKLTLNMGLRWEYATPYYERHDHQALFYPTNAPGPGTGQGVYLLANSQKNTVLAPAFANLLAKDNIQVQYTSNRSLVQGQKTNFAPRFGFAYTINDKTVVRGGYGIFFGGLESIGYYPNLGENFPFEFDSNFPSPTSCVNGGGCPTNGFTLESGFSNAIAAGLQNSISVPSLRGSDPKEKTPYTQDYNLAIEYSLSNNMVVNLSYVGDNSRHLQVFPNPNAPVALAPNGYGPNPNPLQPFPDFGGVSYSSYAGSSNYNSLQASLQKRYSNGLSYLATYTYSHSLDDAPTPLGSTGDGGYRNTNIVPINQDYASSPFDVRHRFNINGSYELPFGLGRQYANKSRAMDYIIGGWMTSLTFSAQTGEPFTVYATNITSPSGASARAVRVSDPFKGGGTPDPNFTGSAAFTCPTKVRTVQNWFNPCAFRNPQPSNITYQANGQPNTVSGAAALAYLGSPRNQINGPGYERVNMSLFKNFKTFREQTFQFRVDAFNVLNTPAYGEPSNTGISANGGLITGARFFQSYTPDSRFFQFAGKYNF